MKFTRLRLIGFKSFVEPTDVLIEPGLTGVVGPNGCGKSNLVEALRWVMGESSHKAMRAADMEDVIFSGSGNRPGRNMAEVAIAIDNSDRTAPAAFNDQEALDVSRRIERDAGSTYRINHREVRARDVHILFADASTGSRSPALVHQGRIGEIIQAKPAQRRMVLEEAAGISGLHARRHEAELRLRAAEQNLLRVEDVIGQLTAQIDALKRQARQAIRYRAVSAEVRKAEAMLYHLRFIAANTDVAEAGRVQDASIRLVAERTGAQAEAATRQALAAAELPGLRDAEAKAAAALHRLNLARETLEREEARARERMAELDRRLVQFGEDIAREQQLAGDAEAALARLAAEEETLRAEAQAAAGRRHGVDERVAQCESVLGAAERSFAELTSALADLTAQRHQLESASQQHAQRLERLAAEMVQVESELAAIEAEQQRGPDLEALTAWVEAAQAAVTQAEADAMAAEAAHVQTRDALDATRAPLAEAERRVQRLETESKTLSKVLAVETKNLWPPVMDSVTVEKGYEAALGAALGDELDAPIDPSSPMRWTGSALDPGDPALPDGVAALSQFVQGPAELARRLAQIGVIERAEGPALAASLKPGQRLVSREGDLWRWDGYAADAHAPTGAARRLAERSRLADISFELEAARSELVTKRASIAAAQAALGAAASAETEARHRSRERQHAADNARNALAAAERDVSRVAARRSALIEAKARLATSQEEAQAARTGSEQALAALPPAAETEEKLGAIRVEIDGDRAALAEARAEAQAIAREAELSNRRLQAIATEQQDWGARLSSATTQIATLETRTSEARLERTGLEDAPAAFAEKRRALIGDIEGAEAERRAAADRLAEAEAKLAEADRDAKAAGEALSAAREEAVRAEERHEAARRRLADINHEIMEMLEVEPGKVAALAGIEAGAELPDVSATEERLEKLRRDRERLGAVNLRAEEELREVEAQYTGLTAERDDLTEAIKKLRSGIQSLNREARERLLASFEVVNGHFQRLFTGLFGGGTAELQLIEAEDPLEAGLEIIAKPPGKKPQTLSLLSGGEQALTALALIFAVFLTNPAPICVLDEVDAPLDDHNVERFCDLLDEMGKATETRFVIITHNPITMARMNRLYGVTMAERGVSQLVSVDLEGAVRLREVG
jgi:chromosome segregation protein